MKTEVKALFKKFNANDKKDVIEFELKGDLSGDQLLALHKLKGGQVFVQISSSQMDLDDLDEEEREGLKYSVNGDGTVIVPANQMTIDEVPKEGQGEDTTETLAAETVAGGANEVDPSDTGGEKDDQGEEVEKGASDQEKQSASAENVTDITQERKRRGRPKKEESADDSGAEKGPDQQRENPTGHTDDDDLPF
ncbi:hypothetical protein J31TS6_62400 [Brevibacillus reuszeri]|uniref:hypothetical protein n=1 Tax=Brevibacillus reuszeri TaxID=54915 RepID=UPI001B03DCCD|nr:hypothetical protein [Brevibacillus reuszeri]GIO10212.1 hypothetical protein J31TS6_62400 [Brevibacillus reuszeri]